MLIFSKEHLSSVSMQQDTNSTILFLCVSLYLLISIKPIFITLEVGHKPSLAIITCTILKIICLSYVTDFMTIH